MTNFDQNELASILDKNLKLKGFSGIDSFFEFKNGVWEKRTESNENNDYSLVVVLNDFNLKEYVESLISFCDKLDKSTRMEWLNNFTKTIFLFGNPEKIKLKYSDIILFLVKIMLFLFLGTVDDTFF